MKRLIRISLLALLPLICCAQSQIGDRNFGSSSVPGPVLVSYTAADLVGGSTSFSITSTGASHLVVVIVDNYSAATSVTVGSQAATKYSTCSGSGAHLLCLWYVASSTGGQTSVTLNSGGDFYAASEYEFSGTNLTSPMDTVGTCTGISEVCTALVTPSTSHDGVIAAFSGSGCDTITGSPSAILNQSCAGGLLVGEATLTSSGTETAIGSSTYYGAIWAFN